MEKRKSQKIAKIYECVNCNYVTSNKYDYNKHILTRKHMLEMTGNERKTENRICNNCNKTFKSDSGLWKHAKKCIGNSNNKLQEDENTNLSDVSNMITPELVMTLLKQNQEFKQLLIEQQQENQKQQEENQKLQTQLLEVVKEGKTVNSHNTTTNSNNKFNLNFFLNEQCKDAMNIADFVNNMVLTVEDLKKTGELGYIDGITKIFTDKLREMDTYNRPMHCTDLKRETLYIKNSDEWAKDTEDKDKIKRAIECVANKNLNNLDTWKEENPGHEVMDSKEDKEFVQIMTNSLGGMGSQREKNKQKIIKNVLKEVIVGK